MSANAKPTPGPWEIAFERAHREGRTYLRGGGPALEDGETIAIFAEPPSEANARLIAAAPALVDALDEVLHRTEANGYGADEVRASRMRAVAALKAAGFEEASA